MKSGFFPIHRTYLKKKVSLFYYLFIYLRQKQLAEAEDGLRSRGESWAVERIFKNNHSHGGNTKEEGRNSEPSHMAEREITKRDATQKEKTVLKRTTGISRRITLSSGEMMNPSRTRKLHAHVSLSNIKICLLTKITISQTSFICTVNCLFLLSLLNSTPQHSTGILLFGTPLSSSRDFSFALLFGTPTQTISPLHSRLAPLDTHTHQ